MTAPPGHYVCQVLVEKLDRAVHANGDITFETLLVACGFKVDRDDKGSELMQRHLQDVHGIYVPMTGATE